MQSSDCPSSDTSGVELMSRGTSEQDLDLMDSDGVTVQVAESDIDSSSDFERVPSDTELLIKHMPRTAQQRRQPVLHNPLTKMKDRLRGCQRSCSVRCTPCSLECIRISTKKIVTKMFLTGGTKLKNALLLLRDRRVLISTALYGLMSFFTIISNEVGSCI